MTTVTLCERSNLTEGMGCPCLGEYGCNLDYNSGVYSKKLEHLLPENWSMIATNCKLVCLVFEDRVFIPERMDMKLPEDDDE